MTEAGENAAVTPLGRPVALNATDSVPPAVIAVETVADPCEPAATLSAVGFTETEKSLAAVDPGPKAATPFGVPSPVGPS